MNNSILSTGGTRDEKLISSGISSGALPWIDGQRGSFSGRTTLLELRNGTDHADLDMDRAVSVP